MSKILTHEGIRDIKEKTAKWKGETKAWIDNLIATIEADPEYERKWMREVARRRPNEVFKEREDEYSKELNQRCMPVLRDKNKGHSSIHCLLD